MHFRKRPKYGNVRVRNAEGMQFDSKKEAARYAELSVMLRAGLIRELEVQPEFALVVNGHKVCVYRADFAYRHAATNMRVVEDVKSPASKTRVYQLKKKLLKAIHNIDIVEL